MSHFFAIAIIPVDCDNPEQYVADMLEPYNEGLEVEPYEEECYCVGMDVRDELEDLIYRSAGEGSSFRYQHNQLREGLGWKDNQWEEDFNPEHAAASQKIWEARYAVRDLVEKTVRTYMADRIVPQPDCEDCHGTGRVINTYNRNRKWDWYAFGGRWNGTIRNEYRGSNDGFNFGEEYRQLGDNVIHVDDYCNLLENPDTRSSVSSFAVITPDGEWLEKGKMGWFACVADEQDADDWMDCLIATFDRYRDGYVAVGLDLHI